MEIHGLTTQLARFVVLYDTPSDIEAFERHYREVHIPLAKHLPGLRRYTVRTAEDAITNLSRYTTIRGMIVRLDDK
jgi:uncharacterized protein (TIGR02118 family)